MASIRRHGAAAILGALSISTCHSSIVGPYAPDTDTLHLWHLNESAVPALDAVSVASGGTNLAALQNAATLGNASFSGFGTAVNTYGPGPNNPGASSISVLTLPNGYVTTSFADPTTGAFTFEAIVKITYNPATAISVARSSPLTIISGEGNTAAARIFNFRLDPVGFNPNAGGYTTALTEPMLEFINLNKASAVQNILIPIPTSGNDAIVQNGWYHVAVTYSGQPGAANNLNFYWTAMDANRTTASLIGSATMNLNLATGGTPCVVIGNTGRNPGGNTANALKDNFLGLIDEVRVSKVARSAGQMMFSTPAISIDVNPVDQVTVLGQTVNFNVSASGVPVLHYQWRHDNVNILNATQAVYTIPAVALADVGAYDVIVTNNYSSVTSSPASLTLRSPVDLTWQGNGYPTWDIGLSPAWRDSGFATAIYTEGDNVTFDAEGAGYPAISIDTPVYPSSVTVNADNDYTFTTSASGGIAGFAGLVKQGIGTLILDENNSYRGGTRIAAGAIQVGSGGTRGSLGTGAITNNGGLVFNRTDAIDVNNKISGTGGITNNGAGTVTLKGTNNYSGDIWGTAGAIVAASPQALGGTTNVTISASLGSPGITGTRFALSGGITVGPNVTLN
ncbi:MAG TPA: autotransporter-associated beta strand repeat-containing protein, partial [Candidatus Paceibacterota bacterium]|nr:autotransporter-associated beta strand repeat-containing protein [Candidatus Paceibacterota bacterium]